MPIEATFLQLFFQTHSLNLFFFLPGVGGESIIALQFFPPLHKLMYNSQSVNLLPGSKQVIVYLAESVFKSLVHCNVKTGKTSPGKNW